MLLGLRCPVCGANGAVPCARCAAAMRRAGKVAAIRGLDGCAAYLSYRGEARELVARLKYRNARASVAWLAAGMAALVDAPVDVVTWAPANPDHVRRRGFDHGELLARAVARRIDRRATALLGRARGAPLTGQSAARRHGGPPLHALAPAPAGRRVLLVDDVITTGATLETAARILRNGGATSVFAVAAAYTPYPSFGPTAASA